MSSQASDLSITLIPNISSSSTFQPEDINTAQWNGRSVSESE